MLRWLCRWPKPWHGGVFFGAQVVDYVVGGAPFILPVIVAVLGLLAVFGKSGVVNQLLEAFGAPPITIYGLQGVVLAHVFFNLPLATRMILQGWQGIPGERFRLAASLGMGAMAGLENSGMADAQSGSARCGDGNFCLVSE